MDKGRSFRYNCLISLSSFEKNPDMTIKTKKEDILVQQFLEMVPVKPHIKGLEQLRSEARYYLSENGLPTVKDEEYKYTAISKKISAKIKSFGSASNITTLNEDLISQHPLLKEGANRIVVNNGKYENGLSCFNKEEIEINSFAELDEEKLSDLVGKIEKPQKDPFTSLNSVAFVDGIFINIPDGIKINEPVYLVNYIQPQKDSSCVFPRMYVQAGKNSEATIIELTVYLDESPVFTNSVSEFNLNQNAQIKHYKIQDGTKASIEVCNSASQVHRDATFTSVVLSLQGDMIRNNLTIDLIDSNCEGNMYGLYLVNGKTHVDNHTNVDHTKPHALSNELYKGIMNDQSKGVFNGKIFVRQDAQKTNAFQQNSNILLSEDATVHTKPQLEIWADDVKCSHGCTTGQLDEEALFYIRSRGIGKDAAKALLLYAFAGEVLNHIDDESFRNYSEKIVHERLGGSY